jgi:Uri superfamily endonuclease
MDKGIYCLVFKTPGCTISVGALGAIFFPAGWYIYVGSALGSGGLHRLGRHISLNQKKNKLPKWHVDYILTSPDFSLVYTVCALTMDRKECQLARELNGNSVQRFGCSDCSCTSHFFYRKNKPLKEILTAFHEIQLSPIMKTIINAQV